MGFADSLWSSVDLRNTDFTFFFPLFGLEVEGGDYIIEDALITKPTSLEWADLERSDVADQIYARGQEPPYFCIFQRNSEGRSQKMMELWSSVVEEFDSLLLALRLHKSGTLVDPYYSGRYAFSKELGIRSRMPGIYRQSVIGSTWESPFRLRKVDKQSVQHLWELVRTYNSQIANPAGNIAMENFRACFGPQLLDRDRVVLLYVALEALFGGFRDRINKVSMWKRAAFAVGIDGRLDNSAQRFLKKKGRILRNQVAHGSLEEPPLPYLEAIDRLREIVRRALVRFLKFCVDQRNIPAKFGKKRGITHEGSLMMAFNEALASTAKGACMSEWNKHHKIMR